MLLSDKLIQISRPHAIGQRPRTVGGVVAGILDWLK